MTSATCRCPGPSLTRCKEVQVLRNRRTRNGMSSNLTSILNLAGGPSWSAVHILAVVRGSDGAYQEASEDLLEQGVRRLPLWFSGITHLLHSGHNKCLQSFKSTRLIFGFIGKQHLHLILKDRPNGTFLLRFSDSEIGGITIAYVSATESRCWCFFG